MDPINRRYFVRLFNANRNKKLEPSLSVMSTNDFFSQLFLTLEWNNLLISAVIQSNFIRVGILSTYQIVFTSCRMLTGEISPGSPSRRRFAMRTLAADGTDPRTDTWTCHCKLLTTAHKGSDRHAYQPYSNMLNLCY